MYFYVKENWKKGHLGKVKLALQSCTRHYEESYTRKITARETDSFIRVEISEKSHDLENGEKLKKTEN